MEDFNMMHTNNTFYLFTLTLALLIGANILLSGSIAFTGICASILVLSFIGKILNASCSESLDKDCVYTPAF